jgi:hypothetical protein
LIKTRIVDGTGQGTQVLVTEDNALLVATLPYSYSTGELKQKIIPFRQYMTLDGTATGTNDMRVNGSSSVPIDFYVPSSLDGDRFITVISFLISDASAVLSKFGNLTALTNGCQLLYNSKDFGDIYFNTALKSNFDFVRFCLGQPSFGDGAGAFRGANVVSTSEGYFPFLDISRLIPPSGLKLDKSTQQKLTFRVRDDVRTVDGFDAIAYGYDLVY